MEEIFKVSINDIDLIAKILLVFELNNKRYISYALDKDDDSFNIYISRLNKNNNLETIDSKEEKTFVFSMFEKYLKEYDSEV